MRKGLYILFFMIFQAALLPAQQIKKDATLTFDVASGLFDELRLWYSWRWTDTRFWYISPSYYHLSRNHETERYQGYHVRFGTRVYLWSNYPPEGYFLQLGGGYRATQLTVYQPDFQVDEKLWIHSPGLTAAFGRNFLYGRKKNIMWGLSGGLEYYKRFYPNGFKEKQYTNIWYELPLFDFHGIVRDIQIFASLEVGFAFKQKKRHW